MTLSRSHLKSRSGLARKAARLLAAAGMTLAVSGCYVAKDTTASIPTDYRKRHPIAIKESDRTVEVFIGKSRGSLNAEQRADVLAFAHVWKREATGGMIIEVPAASPNEIAASQAVREIRSILAAAGVPGHAVVVRPYTHPDPTKLATVRLNFPRVSAEAGPCGLWPHDLGATMDTSYNQNRPYWNLGCANQRNLAAMVDNPADLVQPRGETGVYEARRSVALEKYRKGEEFSGKYPNAYEKAKLSDVGK
ncbi:MAG: CpaD family pilus assembly protein [Pseudorhodoplanes sp.]|jgi:pilus assembly protein CpaD|nr:CpaD family pilus assembly protein [Pseudorhodoplanes sp.]